MDNNAEIDPWAKLGNLDQGTKNNESSQENLEQAEQWQESMLDAPEFSGDTAVPTPISEMPIEVSAEKYAESPMKAEKCDDSIANAGAVLAYGFNAASKEKGVDTVVQAIKNFVPNGQDDPVKQLLSEIGIDTKEELSELSDESRASKTAENAFRTDNINAPPAANKSESGAISAIQDFKELVSEIESAPEYANLRANAMRNGRGIYEEAIAEYNTRDLTTLFNALKEQKEAMQNQKLEAEKTQQESLADNQTENQSSTEKSSPETDATASNGFNS